MLYLYDCLNISVLLFKQWTLRGLCIGTFFQDLDVSCFLKYNTSCTIIFRWCSRLHFRASGFIILIAVVWLLQETTEIRILRYIILFIGNTILIIFFPFHSLKCSISHFFMMNGLLSLSSLANCRCNEQLIFSLWYGLGDKAINSVYITIFSGVTNDLQCASTDADIYDDLISRRVNSSDAEKFAEVCPCPCNGVGWGVIWWAFYPIESFFFFFSVLVELRRVSSMILCLCYIALLPNYKAMYLVAGGSSLSCFFVEPCTLVLWSCLEVHSAWTIYCLCFCFVASARIIFRVEWDIAWFGSHGLYICCLSQTKKRLT